MQNEVYPAIDVLKETWAQVTSSDSAISYEDRLKIAEYCTYIGNMIEMDVIAIASGFREELQLKPQ